MTNSFLEQLRDQSAALLEQSLPPDGFKPETSAKDKAWIDNLLAKQQQAQQHAADAAKAQTEPEAPLSTLYRFLFPKQGSNRWCLKPRSLVSPP
ncbi:hypothetical protein [Providencia hangzhouensis]|uniref:hypothetical protein n=1 Tax=Providencia hangzhouensis TaxID=3031799 RepID=UPI0034DCF50C